MLSTLLHYCDIKMSNRMAMNLDGFRNYVKHIGLILRVYNALYPILFKSFTTSWGFSLYSKSYH